MQKSVKKKRLRLFSKRKKGSVCRIMITSTQPVASGKISVEMTYEGDPALVAYLLRTAQEFVEQESEENSC